MKGQNQDQFLPGDILYLQRTIGNDAVSRMMAENTSVNPIQRKKGTPGLPEALKARLEQISGISMDDVEVHRDSGKPADLGALAYTQGSDIFLGPGQEEHLQHEAWHAVQQKQGRVLPTGSVEGIPLNDSESLEKEADVMGRKAMEGNGIAGAVTEHMQVNRSGRETVQMIDYAKPTKHGNQKGEFVGDPEKAHIHIVTDNTHIKIFNERFNFNKEKADQVQKAKDWLNEILDTEAQKNSKDKSPQGIQAKKDEMISRISGCKSCLNWLSKTYKDLNPNQSSQISSSPKKEKFKEEEEKT